MLNCLFFAKILMVTFMYIIVFLILLIIVCEFIFLKGSVNCKNSKLYLKTRKLFVAFSIIALIIGCGITVCNILIDKSKILDGLFLMIFLLPLEIWNLKNDKIFLIENLSYTKYVVLNKVISKKRVDEYNKAHIRVIMLSNENVKYKIDNYNKSDINNTIFKKNALIRDANISDIKKYIRDYITDDNYNEILEARGMYDNYLKRINFYILCYLPFILCNILFIILGYPFTYNYIILLLFKICNILISKYVYGRMNYDTDIMNRSIRDRGKIFYFQELMIVLMQSFFIFFGLSIVYIYFMTSLYDVNVSNSVFIICYIYMLMWITFVNMSEKIMVINVIKSYNRLFVWIYIVLIIIINILICNVKYFDIYNIGLRACLGCVGFSLLFVIISDVFKLARYTTIKKVRVNKNVKNN